MVPGGVTREEARARVAARQREVLARLLVAMRRRGVDEDGARERLADVERLDLEERSAVSGLLSRGELEHLFAFVFGGLR